MYGQHSWDIGFIFKSNKRSLCFDLHREWFFFVWLLILMDIRFTLWFLVYVKFTFLLFLFTLYMFRCRLFILEEITKVTYTFQPSKLWILVHFQLFLYLLIILIIYLDIIFCLDMIIYFLMCWYANWINFVYFILAFLIRVVFRSLALLNQIIRKFFLWVFNHLSKNTL